MRPPDFGTEQLDAALLKRSVLSLEPEDARRLQSKSGSKKQEIAELAELMTVTSIFTFVLLALPEDHLKYCQ